ncbi:hypothetical protein TrST_g7766 [Triparma strigata]|uniref:Cleft lip and palate associated transmembrane protein n=1 Tax=Triparma strigata TaxID=1606541 RepID=A0A9W7EW94_9STRA|nr:hypothetical protein TrST_g7766 [Triparma strigata]
MATTPADVAPAAAAENPPAPAMMSSIFRTLMFYFAFAGLKSMWSGNGSGNKDLGPQQPIGNMERAIQSSGGVVAAQKSNPLAGFVPDAVLNPYGDDIPKFAKKGPPHTVAWPFGTPIDFDVIFTETFDFNVSSWKRAIGPNGENMSKDPDVLLYWGQRGYRFGIDGQEDRTFSTNFTLTPNMASNTSVYAHIFVTHSGFSIDPASKRTPYVDSKTTYKRVQMNKFRLRKKDSDDRNLLGEWHDQDAGKEIIVAEEDNSVLGKAKANRSEDAWLSYWKPTLHLQLVKMNSPFPRGGLPDQFAHQMDFVDTVGGQYFPVLYVNEFWLTSDKLQAINGTRETLPLEMSIGSIGMFKWQGMSSMQHQWKMQEAMGGRDGESDILVNMITDTNPILLAITIAVSLLHSLFDILAFKNDIAFFKGKKSMEGLSIRTMVVNLFFQVVIFLYLFDNDTSFMVLMSNGVGLLIECWKVTKAVKIGFSGGKITWKEDDGYTNNKTKEYDEIATSHLLYVTMPLMVGYASYSLLQLKFKSWYSWILSSLVGFIYMFGFVMMTPQLFINYKLQSVAHLNWRTMTYKSLNTFVDDLFAFVIKMPIMHRLACFRDDIIFFVFLYQRHIYKTDYSRVNEYGQQAQKPAEEIEDKKNDPVLAAVPAALENEQGGENKDVGVLKRRRGARDK